MTNESRANQPKYERIAAELRGALKRDDHTPGSRPPSENTIAATYGVARLTIRQALELLQRVSAPAGRSAAWRGEHGVQPQGSVRRSRAPQRHAPRSVRLSEGAARVVNSIWFRATCR
jgi:DNA-binding transcriptional MocR family regulator